LDLSWLLASHFVARGGAKSHIGLVTECDMAEMIINCDDLGMHKTINHAIGGLLEKGVISSASIMAPAPAFDHAVNMLNELGIRKIGVHLTANSEYKAIPFYPVSGDQASSLVLPNGVLLPDPLDSKARANMDQLYLELDAQVQKVLRAGFSLTHLDGHMFFYEADVCGPAFLEIAQNLGRKYSVPLRRHGVPALRHFIWEDFDAEAARHAYYTKLLSTPPEQKGELIIHPGEDLHTMSGFTRAGIRRRADYTFFIGEGFEQIVRAQSVKILGWADFH
jgi:chitin disaccharide deacetylase